jgi:hypothetical protein
MIFVSSRALSHGMKAERGRSLALIAGAVAPQWRVVRSIRHLLLGYFLRLGF